MPDTSTKVSRSEFAQWLVDQLERIEGKVDLLLEEAGIGPERIRGEGLDR